MWMRNVATPVALAGIGMTFYAILRRQHQDGEIPDYISCLRYILSSEPHEQDSQENQEQWEASFVDLPCPAGLTRARCEAAVPEIVAVKSDEDIQESNSPQILQGPKSIISKTAFLARVSSFITKIQRLSKESKVREPEKKLPVMPAAKRLSTSETYLKSSIEFIIRREGTYSGLNSSIFFSVPSYFHGPKRQGGIGTLQTSSLTCLPGNFPRIDNAVRLTRSLATTGIPTIEFCTNVKTENPSRQESNTFKVPGASKSLSSLELENNLPRIVHNCATCPSLRQVEYPDTLNSSGYEIVEPRKIYDTCPCDFASCQRQHGDGCSPVQSCTKLQRSQSDLKLQNAPVGDATEVVVDTCSSTGLLSKSSSEITVIECQTKPDLSEASCLDQLQVSIGSISDGSSSATPRISKWRYEQQFEKFLKKHLSSNQNSLNAGADLMKHVASLCLQHKELPLKCLKKAAFGIKIKQLHPKTCLKGNRYCDSRLILLLFFLYALFGVLMLVNEISANVLALLPLRDSEQRPTCLEQWAFSK